MAKVFIEESTLTAIGDAIRDKEGSTELISTTDMADRIGAIETSVEIDPDKILPTTVTGDGFVHLSDVSEIPHDITIQAAEGTKVTVVENFWGANTSMEIQTSGGVVITMPDLTGKTNLVMSAEISGNEDAEFFLCSFLDTNGNTISSPFVRLYPQGNGKYRTLENLPFTINGKPTKIWVYSGSSYANAENKTTKWSKIQFFDASTEKEVTAPTTVKSSSPYMDFTADTSFTISYNKSWGMNEEYNRFWNIGLSGSNWAYKCAGPFWNDRTFRPNQDIKPTGSAFNLFFLSEITDLCKILNDCGVVLDTSGITARSDFMFTYCSYLTTVPYLDLRNANWSSGVLNSSFAYCPKLKSIEGIHLKEDGSQKIGDAFTVCYELEEVRFYGTIGSALNMRDCTKLSKESIISIVNALATGRDLDVTLSQTAVNNAFPDSAEWYELMYSRPEVGFYLV